MSEKSVLHPGERFFLWFLAAFSLAVLIYSLTLSHADLASPGTFPLLIGSLMLLSILRILWSKRKLTKDISWRQEMREATAMMFPRAVAVFALILIIYIVLMEPLHFLTSSFLFLVVSFLFLKGTKSWLRALIIAAGVLGGIFLLFRYIFQVILW